MSGWEEAEERGLEPSLRTATLSPQSPVAFRGSRGGTPNFSSTFSSRSFAAQTLITLHVQSSRKQRIFVPNFRQLACLACGQITLIPPAAFPPAFTTVESLSPTGDCLPDVCLCHQTLSSTRVGGLSFSLLSPHGSFTQQIFVEHLPCDSCCAKCFNIIVEKK